MTKELGVDLMIERISKLNYPRMQITPNNYDDFWVEGESKISPFEKI